MAGDRCDRDPRSASSGRGTSKKGRDSSPRLSGDPEASSALKIHAVVDALGLPIRFILGPGQQNAMAPARDLIRGILAVKVLADRAYDADSLHNLIYEQGGEPVITPRRHRKYSAPI